MQVTKAHRRKVDIFHSSLVFLFLFLASNFSPLTSQAHAASIDDTVSMIEKKAGEIKDISGSFTQQSYLTDLERTETYSGNFSIKKPDIVKWTYAEPRDEEVYITADQIWIYKRQAKQAVKSKFSENAYGQAPIALLGSLENLKASFDITDAGKADTLKLIPKRKIGSIKEILMQTNSGDFPVTAFTIFDTYGNNVIITIKNVSINMGLPSKAYIFEPTDDMEIFEY